MKIDIQKHVGNKELYYVGELTSKIIQGMQLDGEVYLWSKEGKNSEQNGLYQLLDELCGFWKWDKKNITIDTTNLFNVHDCYNIVYTYYSHPAEYFNVDSATTTWNGSMYYGMFIGRATASRIYALHKHHNFKFKHKGLTSFHTELFNFMSLPELVDYFFYSNQTYKEMLSIPTPYSDIDEIKVPPITPLDDVLDWSTVYEKIAIEVVCETSTEPNCYEISEKILRPMYYKRPFLLIGSPKNLTALHKVGFKTFNHLFDESYDQLGESNFARVNRVFKILQYLVEEYGLEKLLQDANDILEHNHYMVIEYHKHHKNFNYVKYINDK